MSNDIFDLGSRATPAARRETPPSWASMLMFDFLSRGCATFAGTLLAMIVFLVCLRFYVQWEMNNIASAVKGLNHPAPALFQKK